LVPRRVRIDAEGCVGEAWLCRDRSCAGVPKSVPIVQGTGVVELEPGAWLVHGRCDDGRRSPAIAFQVTATGFTRPAGMDVNGDGYADLVVGAGTFGEPLPGARRGPGAVAVYFGGPSGIPEEASQIVPSPEGGLFGTQLGAAGDVNRDGYDDVLATAIIAPWVDEHGGEGRTYLLHGSPGGLVRSDWTFVVPPTRSASSNRQSTPRIAARGVGDVNGDGYPDVAIGIATGRATVWLYEGGPGGLNPTPSSFAEDPDTESFFGWDVIGGIDLNEDRHADIAVAFQAYDPIPIYLNGGPDGITYDTSVRLGPPSGCPGSSFAVADYDGDGHLELAMGSFLRARRGMVGVFKGLVTSGRNLHPIWVATGERGDNLGRSLAAADVNGDGKTDLVTGVPLTVLYGGEAPPGPGFRFREIESRQQVRPSNSRRGERLTSPGDLNGDGFADVAISTIGTPIVEVYFGSAQGLEAEPRTELEMSYGTQFGLDFAP
ncbi:MAG: FG-GAP-like repeat-containing protein, partial [Myxococcota bacterium]